MILKKSFSLLIIFFTQLSWGEENLQTEDSYDQKIHPWSVISDIPDTSYDALRVSFSKESVPYWAMIITSSALLYKYDEDILDSVQMTGRKWGIGNDDKTRPLFQVGPWDVRFPTDKGSTLYFLGDGITHFTIAGSLIGYGYFSDNIRPYNTGLQIVHGMAVSTIFSQLLKRSFGRESPVRKSKDRGAWEPFPSISEYNDNTATYDAMPSGHVMTATLTFTIIMENYPEHSYWLLPLEVTWVSLLGLQMVNNGVHWASDYPLGIAMGYVFGKASAKLGKPKKKKSELEMQEKVSWQIVPSVSNGTTMANFIMTF